MTTLVLAFAAALQAQYALPPPYEPYAQPNPWATPSYHQPQRLTPQAVPPAKEQRRG